MCCLIKVDEIWLTFGVQFSIPVAATTVKIKSVAAGSRGFPLQKARQELLQRSTGSGFRNMFEFQTIILSPEWNVRETPTFRCAVRSQYHPRLLLQQIEKWKKPSVPHPVGNVGHTGSIVCHHSVTAPVAAPRFRDKRGSHECTSLFHTPPRFLHVLYFRGRPIPRKFYSVKFFHVNLL